jgi:hypothetical protein
MALRNPIGCPLCRRCSRSWWLQRRMLDSQGGPPAYTRPVLRAATLAAAAAGFFAALPTAADWSSTPQSTLAVSTCEADITDIIRQLVAWRMAPWFGMSSLTWSDARRRAGVQLQPIVMDCYDQGHLLYKLASTRRSNLCQAA